jgi:hypothetical protein
VTWHTDQPSRLAENFCMVDTGTTMRIRRQQDRRMDSSTAERFDLAVLAARAFDLHAGHNYLVLSGVSPLVVHGFVHRYPQALRKVGNDRNAERRNFSPSSAPLG